MTPDGVAASKNLFTGPVSDVEGKFDDEQSCLRMKNCDYREVNQRHHENEWTVEALSRGRRSQSKIRSTDTSGGRRLKDLSSGFA